jgi:hypothetical protein
MGQVAMVEPSTFRRQTLVSERIQVSAFFDSDGEAIRILSLARRVTLPSAPLLQPGWREGSRLCRRPGPTAGQALGRKQANSPRPIGDASRCPRSVSKPPAADTRTPSTWMPNVAASRYMSLRTHPAAARCNRWAPLNTASTVTPSDVQRCGNWIAWASCDLNEPALTTTSNWFIGTLSAIRLGYRHPRSDPYEYCEHASPRLDAAWGVDVTSPRRMSAAGSARARAGGGGLRQRRGLQVSTVTGTASLGRA